MKPTGSAGWPVRSCGCAAADMGRRRPPEDCRHVEPAPLERLHARPATARRGVERPDAGEAEVGVGNGALKAELPQLLLAGPEVPRLLAQLHPLELPRRTAEVLIIGGGVAGLSAGISA